MFENNSDLFSLSYPKSPISMRSKDISYFNWQVLNTQINLSLGEISAVGKTIVSISKLFDTTQNITPADCDEATDSIEALENTLDEFYGLLSNSETLPTKLIPYRYKLLATLYLASDDINQLSPLLRRFRPFCLESTQQKKQLQNQIRGRFLSLVQKSEKIEQEFSEMLELTSFHFDSNQLIQ